MSYASHVYDVAQVKRPDPDRTLQERANAYRRLATACDARAEDVDTIIGDIERTCSGPAVEKFKTAMRDATSLHTKLPEFSAAATLTADRLEQADATLRAGVQDMDQYTLWVANTWLTLISPIAQTQRAQLINKARQDLHKKSDSLASTLSKILRVELPQEVGYHSESEAENNVGGVLDQQTIDRWTSSEMDESERETALNTLVQQMAQRQHVDPPPTVEIIPDKKGDPAAAYYPDDNIIRIQSSAARDGSVFGTLGHELGHAEQTQLVTEYRNLSPADVNAIRSGSRPDPFAEHDMSIDDVEYMSQVESTYDPQQAWKYRFHLKEVHSEQTRAEEANRVTDQEINKAIDDAT